MAENVSSSESLSESESSVKRFSGCEENIGDTTAGCRAFISSPESLSESESSVNLLSSCGAETGEDDGAVSVLDDAE